MNVSRNLGRFAGLCFALSAMLSGAWTSASAQKATTITTLAVTSTGRVVTTVASGSVVTLTASVRAGSTQVTRGQVNFCDASATYCTDVHLLGTAQLTSAGTATLRLRPALGSRSYKAVFLGTTSEAASSSSISALSVVGSLPSTASITQSGYVGNYTLTATVSSSAKTLPGPTGTVSFLNTGDGNSVLATAALGGAVAAPTLVNVSNPQVGNEPSGIVTADFNGDGIPDLAVGINETSQSVSILLGDGTGNFTQVTTSPITASGTPVLTQDFNGDGIQDLLLSNEDDNTVTVLLGNGDGTFHEAPGSPFVGAYPVVAGDFNGDGIPDLATGGLLIWLGKGDGSFTEAPPSSSLGGAIFGSMAVGDVNGDGVPDLAALDSFDEYISILFGNGDGTFTKGPPIMLGMETVSPASSLVTGDFNGDGKLDLAVTLDGTNSVAIFLGNGDGTFQSASGSPISVGPFPSLVSIGDFNGDGVADLYVGVEPSGTTLNVLLGNGDGTFTQTAFGTAELPCCTIGVLGDFNGDGLTDIASPSFYNSTAQVLLTQFIQATATVTGISPVGTSPVEVVASYSGDSNYNASISGATSLTSVVAAPAFSLASRTYSSVETVTITDATPGATIYYWASGTVNTNGFVPYTAAIPLTEGGFETIQAYATETGYQQSNFATATYTLNLSPAPPPVITLASGVYPGPQSVTISAPGETIYYTTNGSLPTTSSSQYSGPIAVSSSETLVATAIASRYSMSAPASAQYIIESSPASFIYTIAGNGSNGYTGDGGLATVADLNNPVGSVMDGAGNLYIADANNNVIRKVAAGTGVITTFAGTGTAGYSGDNGAATSAQLNFPAGLSLDGTGDLYFADENNSVVRMISAATGVITTVAGNGTQGYGGDGNIATNSSLSDPLGTAVDSSGNLYIADAGNSRIREVAAKSGIITIFAGNGQFGYAGDGGPATAAELYDPWGVAVDNAGNLYIADTENQVVRKVNAGTGVISTIAGSNSTNGYYPGGYSGDGGPATDASGYNGAINVSGGMTIQAIAVAPGHLISNPVSAAYNITSPPAAVINTVAGDGVMGFAGAGGPATSAQIGQIAAMTIDSAGDLFFTDTFNSVVWMVSAVTGDISIVAGNGTPGFSGDGGPATSAQMNSPDGIAVDSAGNLYISDSSNSVVREVVASTGLIKTIAGTPGQGGYPIGDGRPATSAYLNVPRGLALDAAGNLYIADSYNNEVRMVSASSGIITRVAGNGGDGFSGAGGPATSATLQQPNALAFDSGGNLYIASYSIGRICKVDKATGTLTTVAGNGNRYGDSGDGGLATSAEIYPLGLVLDSTGNLYISNWSAAVREVSASTGVITRVVGNGYPGYFGDGGSATAAQIQAPQGIVFDALGNLYIADSGNYRVRKVTFPGPPQITSISPNYGAPAALIVITGANFGATQGDGGVTVGGAPSRVVSWSNTAIAIQVPSRATTGDVVVTAGGVASNGVAFTFYPYPAITEISPASGTAGTPVTITGIGLMDGEGNGAVTFNGTPATILSQSGTSIQVSVPYGATTGPISVRANGDTVKSSSSFSVVPSPTISGISPNYGAPAALIEIAGTDFGATQSNGSVTVGGAPSRVVSWSNTAIAIQVPSRATTGDVVVTAAAEASNGVAFTFYPYPAITGISPASGPVGTPVTIAGAGLLDGEGHAAVTFNGTPATILSEALDSVQVEVPARATTGPVSIRVNGDTVKSSSSFTVIAPQISSISQNYGAPAALISITGSNFGTTQGNGIVTVGGALSYVVSWSSTQIAILVPSRAKSGNIVVTTAGEASNGEAFTFYPYPTITSVSPASGVAGTVVTITGTSLLDGGGDGIVAFNGIPATILSQTSTSIQVKVPAAATTGPITVRVNGVTLKTSTNFTTD